MFREATYAAANPRNVSAMISENLRRIRDLRVKKLSIIKTSASLFGGITFGIAFSIYVSLVIAEHMNTILNQGMGGGAFDETNIELGTVLSAVPPEMFAMSYLIAFLVLIAHSFILSYTLKDMRGSHTLVTLFFFVPFAWTVAVTSVLVESFLSGYLVIE